MSDSSHNSQAWFDDELRKVLLPAGLRDRLKAIAAGEAAPAAKDGPGHIAAEQLAAKLDAQIDAALCDVLLPHGLIARLTDIPQDAALDERLREVAVPAGLAAKLHAIPSIPDETLDELLIDDQELDLRLCDLPVPAGLEESLQVAFRNDLRDTRLERRRLLQFALAASLLVSLSTALFTSTAAFVAYSFGVRPGSPPGVEAAPDLTIEVLSPEADDFATLGTLELPPAPTEPELQLNIDGLADAAADLPPGMTQELMSLFASDRSVFDPLADVFLAKHNFLAVPSDDSHTELQTVDWLPARGASWPRVKEFDLLYVIRFGKNPPISPAAHEELRTAHVPLVTTTAGYDRARAAIAAGRLPAAEELRTEDFLAAVPYDFDPPAESALGLRTAAGPSPWRDTNVDLLQVGVQAGAAADAQREPVRLIVAVDLSASLTRGSRLEEVRRALSHLVRELESDDRLSLVAFNGTAEVLFKDASRQSQAELLRAIDALRAEGATNLAAGLREAAHLAMSGSESESSAALASRVVVLTDGPTDLSEDVFGRLSILVEDASRAGVRFEFVDLRTGIGGTRPPRDERLAHLALAGGGRLRSLIGAEALRFGLVEFLTGHSAVVAKAARLSVTFNPQTVAEYRLVGHEAAVGAATPGTLEADLREGETATALFEVKLLPTGGDDVATATLVWRDPATGAENSVTQRISRLQFATSLAESAGSLQRAAVVAELAEVLRLSKSPAGRTAALARVRDVVVQLPPAMRSDPAMAELLRLVAAAQQPASKPRGQ